MENYKEWKKKNKRKGRNKCPESRMVKADQEFDMIRRCLRVLGGNKVKEDDDVDKENLFKNRQKVPTRTSEMGELKKEPPTYTIRTNKRKS